MCKDLSCKGREVTKKKSQREEAKAVNDNVNSTLREGFSSHNCFNGPTLRVVDCLIFLKKLWLMLQCKQKYVRPSDRNKPVKENHRLSNW